MGANGQHARQVGWQWQFDVRVGYDQEWLPESNSDSGFKHHIGRDGSSSQNKKHMVRSCDRLANTLNDVRAQLGDIA
jgi:hypothetical protein